MNLKRIGENKTNGTYYQKKIGANPNNAIVFGNYAKFLKGI